MAKAQAEHEANLTTRRANLDEWRHRLIQRVLALTFAAIGIYCLISVCWISPHLEARAWVVPTLTFIVFGMVGYLSGSAKK